ncbi:MAG: DNA primase, partial [Candidatus Hydrogenedentota bacterium]
QGKQETNIRKQLVDLGSFALTVYQQQLNQDGQDNAGSQYLASRKLSAATIESFGLGYVPEAWQTLTDAARAKGFPEDVLLASGLSKRGDRGNVYDHFRNRLMFPIRDTSGNVAAFGGRALGDDPAKYINSPETPLYKKSNVLYGLYEARTALRDTKRAYLVEGYFDLLRLVDSGIPNVVATCGTALTPGQAKLMKRYVDEVVVVYDGDAAGIKAALRSVDILVAAGLTVRALVLPDGQDPDDFILNAGVDAFNALAESAPGFVTFYARMNEQRSESIEGRNAVAQELFDIIRNISAPIQQDEYIKLIAKELRIGENSCRQLFHRNQNEDARPSRSTSEDSDEGPRDTVNEYDRDFIACLLKNPKWLDDARAELEMMVIPTSSLREVLDSLLQHQGRDHFGLLGSHSAKQLYSAASNAKETWGEQGKAMIDERIAQFKQGTLKIESDRVQDAITRAQESNDDEEVQRLFSLKIGIEKRRQQLRS